MEAALQSAHVQRLRTGSPAWPVIVRLYDRLLAVAPTAGFAVGRIAALQNAAGPESALTALNDFHRQNPDLADHFAPYLVTRAHCLWQLGRRSEAQEVARTAVTMTNNESEKLYLTSRFQLAAP